MKGKITMAKDTSKYKNLYLNLDDIYNIIMAWGIESEFSNVNVESPKDMNAQTLNYLVNCDGKVATVAIFPAKGGVYTISPNIGKEKEISALIADYIVLNSGKLADSNPYKNGLSLDMARDDFFAFYDLLKGQNDVSVEEERTDAKNDFFVRLKNERYRDSIVISHYHTGKMLIQGKPLELFSLAVEILSDDYDLQKIVNAEAKSTGFSIAGDDIISDMSKSLGNAYDFLSSAHKAILANAYIFYRTNISVVGGEIQLDYSMLFFPAARTLEGYIFKLLVNNNVLHDGDEGLGFYFRGENDNVPLVLHSQFEAAIDNDIVVREINRLYQLFHKLRHPYFHASERDYTTSVITDRKVADTYFREIIEAISKSYDTIVEAKKNKK